MGTRQIEHNLFHGHVEEWWKYFHAYGLNGDGLIQRYARWAVSGSTKWLQ